MALSQQTIAAIEAALLTEQPSLQEAWVEICKEGYVDPVTDVELHTEHALFGTLWPFQATILLLILEAEEQ